MKTVYLVVPCYNEEEVLPETAERLTQKLDELAGRNYAGPDSRIVFIDDGSRDKTWKIIERLHSGDKRICGIKLSHNRGHQYALLAGLMAAKAEADCAISLDADLQDDIEVLDQFLEKFNEGCDIVYGVRNSRETDTFFKRRTAMAFYSLMKALGVDIVYNHADYRLLSKRALDTLSEYRESNLFLRGIIPQIGYKSDFVYYERQKRLAGESKYPLNKMIAFAINGITSFSVKPLSIIAAFGIIISFFSIAGILYALLSKLFGYAVSGWTAILCSIWLLGGLQMFSLGVVGAYIGEIYNEVKARPRYTIEQVLK